MIGADGEGGAGHHLAQGEDARPKAVAAHDLAQGGDEQPPGRPEPAAADERQRDQPDEMRRDDDGQRRHHHADGDGDAVERVPLQPLAARDDQPEDDGAREPIPPSMATIAGEMPR